LEVFDTICCVLLAQYADYEKLIKTFVAQTNKQTGKYIGLHG
jgi:hypothetical protein